MKKILIAAAMICLGLIAYAQPSKKTFVILDADIGSSTDDVFAIRKLYQYMSDDKCQLLGVICDRKGAINARMADVLLTYYNAFFKIPKESIPRIGWERDDSYPENARVFIDYCDSKNWDKESSNWNEVSVWSGKSKCNLNNLPTGSELYSQILSNPRIADHSVTIICIGFMTSLNKFLDTEDGIELFKKKVKKVYIMGTHFAHDKYASKWGYNLGSTSGYAHSVSPSYAAKVLAKLQRIPTIEIIFSPSEVGEYIGRYEINDVVKDFEGMKEDPLYIIYTMKHKINESNGSQAEEPIVDSNQYMWDVLPVIACFEGDSLFTMSKVGRIDINIQKNPSYILIGGSVKNEPDKYIDSQVIFTPDSTGNVRFQESIAFKELKSFAKIFESLNASHKR